MISRISALWRPDPRGARGASRRRRAPALEGLEDRALLAWTPLAFPGWGGLGGGGGVFGPVTISPLHPPTWGALPQAVQATQIPTSLTVSGPANPVSVGQQISFSALVGISSGTTPPTGTVTFSVDGKALPPAQVNANGFAFATSPGLSAGNHTVTAMYSGNFLYAPSSGGTTQQVNKAVAAARLTASTTTPTANQSVYLNVQLSAPAANSNVPPYSGTVSFFDNGTPIGSVQVNSSGFAQLIRKFAVGGHTITAMYGGNANFLSANSNPVSLLVQPGGGGGVGQAEPGPTVVSVQRFGYHWQPTTLALTFNSPMDATRAQNPAAYRIVGPGGQVIPVTSATYDPASQSVTLTPAQRLNLHYGYRLTVFGSGPNALTDAAGVPLDGAGNGQPGTNFMTVLTARNLVIPGYNAWQTAMFLHHYGLA